MDQMSTKSVEMPDDAALLPRLLAGEESAVRVWVEGSTPRLLAVARRYLGDESEACDAVQEAFIGALRGLRGFEGGSRLSTWLHRICVNACLMRLRKRAARGEESLEGLLPRFRADGHAESPVARWRAGPEVDDRPETMEVVRSCLGRLPDAYRVVLLLRDVEGLSTEETATALGTTPNAVKLRLHRARQALRGLLEPHLRGSPVESGMDGSASEAGGTTEDER